MKNLSCFAYVLDDDFLWLSDLRYNGLFKIDLHSSESEFIGNFTCNKMDAKGLHFCAEKYENTLYFFPQTANGIDAYDISTNNFFDIDIFSREDNQDKTIVETFIFDKKCILVPRFKEKPLRILSLEDRKIIDTIELPVANKYANPEKRDLSLYACMVNDAIYYSILGTNCIGCYYLNKKKEKVYVLHGIKEIIGDIEFDGNDIWLSADDGIYKWNPRQEKLTFVSDCVSEERWIEQFIIFKENIICIPRWLGKITIINRETLEQENIEINTSILHGNVDTPWRDVKGCFVWNGKLVILPVRFGETIFVDLNNYEVSFNRYLSEAYISMLGNATINEENTDDLNDYVAGIIRHNDLFAKASKKQGEIIWNHLCESIDKL